jgi:uncharacterized membrane protein
MTWLQRYRFAHYVGNSIWVFPVLAIIAAMLLVRFVHQLEEFEGWQADFDPDSMRAALGNLAGSMFTFVVFVCSSLLLVVQLASAQLTPRIIGVLFRDPVMKLTLSMFVFTFTFSIAALVRIGSSVPRLTAEVAAYSSVVCIGLFLYLIDRVGKMLRPSGALQSVAAQAHQVIENVYPRRLRNAGTGTSQFVDLSGKTPESKVVSNHEGVVLAFDLQGIVDLAVRHDCVIELVPQVGSFVGPGNPLFRVYGSAGVPARSLLHSIALGAERTMEQDPAFAFRVMVDIASKGLSPAINDPTTAVLALDRIHHLLRHVGNRCLENERVRDATGKVRLIFRTPDWEDFVALAVTEIRQFGGTSIQIARRLRAMLEDLIRDLSPERAVLLRQELEILRRSADRFFPEPEDRALAGVSDFQGVGGKKESNPAGQGGVHVH